ncbi:MAG: DUF5723 family protein [Sphingobacteriaceae bacterium]
MKKVTLLLLLCALKVSVFAQGFGIFNNSNYAPVQSVYFNPSKIADSKQKFQFNLVGFNVYVANDYGVLQSIPKLIRTVQNNGEFGDILTLQQNGKNKNVDLGLEIRGPSFVAAMGHSQSLAFTTRARLLSSANNVSEELMTALVKGFTKTDQYGNITNATFDLNANLFSEMGLTYALNLINTGNHVFKAGVTGKYLWGAGNAQINNINTSVNITSSALPPLTNVLTTNGVHLNTLVSNSKLLGFQNTSISLKDITDGRGQGFGADFGFEYEWRPKFKDYQYEVDGKTQTDNTLPKYRLKIGAALTDVGSITYGQGKIVKLNDNTQNKQWTQAQIDNFDLADLETSFINVYGAGAVASSLNYKAHLPTRLNVNLDLKVAKNFYIASNYMGGFTKKRSSLDISKEQPVIDPTGTLISVVPRIEKPSYELALPITYSSRYKKTNIGLTSRTGAFFIGTDDIGGALGIGKFTSFNLYAGLNFSIGKKRIKDRDHDTISDKLDKCPTIAGPVENDGCPWPDTDKDGIPDKDDGCPTLAGPAATHGCPDSDGDGVADNADNCPSIPGPLSAQGCPDADGDGIPDKDDLCPTLPGSRDAKGCPDRDHDGIADKDDKCPDVAGTAALLGCPDKDNDGVADSEDLCPDVPGSIALKGCPDRDNDGVADKDDACPDLAGPFATKGCPDTDGDGVLDKDDLCPTVPGPLAFKGCPDRDKDGVSDAEDLCPDIPGSVAAKGCPDRDGDGVPDKDDKCIDIVGPASNGGCPITAAPVLSKVEEKIIFTAVSDLQFETGKSTIKAYSFDSLDELAALMVKRKELTLILSGHTDNVGVPAKNKVLSRKRAEAVKAYLEDASVDGSRIAAVGYGSSKPVASNKTPQGRQKNRRVEFKVN